MTEERQFDGHGGGRLSAFVALPATLPAPGLVLLQEVYGVNRFMRRIAGYWAAQGFVAVCPDVYWRMKPGIVLDPETPGHREQALATGGRLDVDLAVRDVAGLVEQLRGAKECSGRVATAGYCLGGKLAYLVGTRGAADCNVSYYGVGIEAHLDEAAKLARPLLMHMGEADPWTPEAVRARLKDAFGASPLVTMHLYPETGHAFAREGAATDVPAMRELANGRTRAFLEANLR
jgi:carboxymethylenebutenolidase